MSDHLVLAIPNRNGSRYIADTLRSLISQDAPVHWWLQDAQSSDESLELAHALARKEDVISCEIDRGQPDALNKAFARMGGDIIGFINSDDILLPGAARRILDEFNSHPEADMIVGGIQYIDAEGNPIRAHRGSITSLEEILNVYHFWWKDRQFVQPEVFWRRSLWDKVGPFNAQYCYAFDYEYWVRCFRAGARVRIIDQPLAAFRLHAAQKSTAAVAAADEIRDILGKTLLEPLPIDRIFRWKLGRYLSYDQYQLGRDTKPGARRAPFFQKLLCNPGWLLVPEVQLRLKKSLRKYVEE